MFFILFCSLLSFALYANESTNSTFKNLYSEEIILKLDLGDLTNKSENQIKSEIEKFIIKNLQFADAELQCKVEVTGTINVMGQSISISVEVSGPCSEIVKSGTQIANQILEAVKKALK